MDAGHHHVLCDRKAGPERDPARIDEILGTLRAASPGLFTVKMRIGFDDTSHFDRIIDLC